VLITEEQIAVSPPQYEFMDEKALLEDVKAVAV